MQSDHTPPSGRRWLSVSRAIVLGILLGIVQSVLFILVVESWFNHVGWAFVASVAFLYLLIPALEGFLSARRDADASAGVSAGCLTGGTSIPAVIIGVITATVWILNTESLVCTDCPTSGFYLYFPPIEPDRGSVALLIFLVMIVASVGGVGGGFIGGWIGGGLGQKFAHTSHPRSRTTAGRAL